MNADIHTGTLTDRNRFYDIDLLRFLAALVVVLYHYTFIGYAAGELIPAEFPVFNNLSRYGYLGVHLFFIISGFVIMLSAEGRSPAAFTISRITRLYPGYWICVTATALTIFWFGGETFRVGLLQYLANMTMLHQYFYIDSVDGVYWTLAVELKFYFLVFLILLARQLHRVEWYLVGWFIVSGLLLIFEPGGALQFFLFPRWSFYFIAGAFFYQIHARGTSPLRVLMICGCYLVSAWLATGATDTFALHYGAELDPLVLAVVIGTMFLLFAAIVSGKTERINHPMLFYLGILTYPLYLLHQNIGFILIRTLTPALPGSAAVALTTAMMLGAAWLVYVLVEKPGTMWLRKSLHHILPRQVLRFAQQQRAENS